jgi:GT2 family glycosyltransferase/spore maturation protein CgeB
MLDDSYLYKKDYEQSLKNFQKQGLDELFSDLYASGRLSEGNISLQEFSDFLHNYDQNLSLINTLIRENYRLQLLVHELGIKNRIRKKVGLFRPLQIIDKYITSSEFEDILNGTFINKSYLPLMSFSKKALEIFKNLSNESFEGSLQEIQNNIPAPQIKNPPLVSIVVTTRNGIEHLKRLFMNFDQLAGYKHYEIIVVDNMSDDGTTELLKNVKNKLNLRFIQNSENKSFSESNNIGAKEAKGSYIMFLNNDISPTMNWLGHMMSTVLKDKNIGAVGAKLIYPHKPGFENSYKIQHGGIGFMLEDNFIRPVNVGNGKGFLESNIKREEEKAGVTAACLLIEKVKFHKVGGFDEAYWYGYEDVDFCLKLNDSGYKNVINNAAVLFHHEFGTQSKTDTDTISNYRKKNMNIFKNKWQYKLYPKLWQSLLGENNIYTDKQLHIGFAVSEASNRTAAGDYFTAKELGNALEIKGYRVSYISVMSAHNRYEINPDIDVLISMIDDYDVGKIENNKVIKVAWCRNWFERWAEREYFRSFDIILTNSEVAQQYFKDKLHIDSYIFKIATNKGRFTKQYTEEELAEYKSDVCFTGNYWHVPRDISELLDVDKLKDRYKIKIFGKDWNHVKSLKPFWQGFLEYKDIPKVYAAGKILIDDAIFTTNKWGSVNSRVFDGAVSGILVLTNGAEGSKQTFNGLIPTYSNKEELSELLEKYLSDDKLRHQKIDNIRSFVLDNHTYKHRADELLEILKKELARKTINIKLPIPRWSEAKQWGDLYFGQGLKRELEKSGLNVKIQILPEWEKDNFAYANIVLRGLSVFNQPSHQLNIMWNISHPEKVPVDEYKNFDYVFVASSSHTDNLKKRGLDNVYVLYQCFDETVFNAEPAQNPVEFESDILFVGNTRNQFRKIVRDIISWGNLRKYNFKVYGQGWKKFIDKKYIGGDLIENSELKYYYQNTKILLNDHWDDMNDHAIASNRLFDASACGTFIISDSNSAIKELFGSDVIEEYESRSSLYKLLDYYSGNPEARRERADKARAIVFKNHTFSHRTDQLLSIVKELQ